MSHRSTLFIAFVSAVFLVGGFLFLQIVPTIVKAAVGSFSSPVPITGHMWAGAAGSPSEGVGWISLSCTDGGPTRNDICGSSNYGVFINPNKTVVGYAWSESIGWIKFGGLSGCPSGNCTARIIGDDTNGWEISGWARACAVYANKNTCSGSLDPDRGGWDGWISLNCANNNGCGQSDYKILFTSSGDISVNSYAWGSDVVGRVSFTRTNFTSPCSPSYQCTNGNETSVLQNMWCDAVVSEVCQPGFSCVNATGRCEADIAEEHQLINISDLTLDLTLIRNLGQVEIAWNTDFAGTCEVRGGGETFTTSPSTSQTLTAATTYTLYCIDSNGDEIEGESETVRVIANIIET